MNGGAVAEFVAEASFMKRVRFRRFLEDSKRLYSGRLDITWIEEKRGWQTTAFHVKAEGSAQESMRFYDECRVFEEHG